MSIIDKLSAKYIIRNRDVKTIKKLAVITSFILLAAPTLFLTQWGDRKISKRTDEDVVKVLMQSVKNQKDLDTVVRPYFKDNVNNVQFVPETYDSLQKLQDLWPLAKKADQLPQSIDTNNLVKIDGSSRLEVGTNIYFSQSPLHSAAFIPEWKMIFDGKGKSLYHMNAGQQRLENPVNEVSSFLNTKGEQYIVQGKGIFVRKGGKFSKIYEGIRGCNLQEIIGTPYFVALGGEKPLVLGKDFTDEEQKVKTALEERLGRDSFIPGNITKITYFEGKVYVGTSKQIVILDEFSKIFKPEGENAKMVDYIPVPASYGLNKLLISQSYTQDKSYSSDKETVHVIKLYHHNGFLEKVFSTERNDKVYGFPKNPSDFAFDWIRPNELKAQVAYKLKNESKRQEVANGK